MGYKFHAERPTEAIEFKEANREAISDFKIKRKDFLDWEVTFDSHLELEELKSLIGEINHSMGETLERHTGIKQYNPQNTITCKGFCAIVNETLEKNNSFLRIVPSETIHGAIELKVRQDPWGDSETMTPHAKPHFYKFLNAYLSGAIGRECEFMWNNTNTNTIGWSFPEETNVFSK